MSKMLQKAVSLCMAKIVILGVIFILFAQSDADAQGRVYVRGYYRSNGTYVKPHYRTAPDSNPYNNYSFPGNYNPNKGTFTTGSRSAYLNRYYKRSASSVTTPRYAPTYRTRSRSTVYDYDGLFPTTRRSTSTPSVWRTPNYSKGVPSLPSVLAPLAGYRYRRTLYGLD